MVKETSTVRNLRLKWASYLRWYGTDDPRTIAADIELARVRAEVARAEADRLQAIHDEKAGALAVAS